MGKAGEVVAGVDGGFSLPVEVMGEVWVAGCPGFYVQEFEVGRGGEVRLESQRRVAGLVQFETDVDRPEPALLRASASGANVLGDGFVAFKFEVRPDYGFAFEPGQAKSLDLSLRHVRTRQELGTVTWRFPQEHVVIRARAPSPEGAAGIARRIVVQLDAEYLAAWQAGALGKDLRRVELFVREAGEVAARASAVVGGAGQHVESRIGSRELSDVSPEFDAVIRAGTYDFELRDHVLGTSFVWRGTQLGSEQQEVVLAVPGRGSVSARLHGIDAAEVALMTHPAFFHLLSRDGAVVLRAYCPDGQAGVHAPCVAPGRYFALAYADNAEHPFLRSPLVPCEVVEGQVSALDLFLEPAGIVEIHADVGPHAGTIESVDGVVLHRFDLRERKHTSLPLAPGDYVVVTGGSRRAVRVSREAVAAVHLPL